MNQLDEKFDIGFRAAVLLVGGLAGFVFSAYKAYEEFTWGDDAAWGYVLIGIGAAMLAGIGLRQALGLYRLLMSKDISGN